MAALRARLTSALRTEFERAREQSGHRLGDAVAPYARFVHAEERRWSEARQTLTRLRERTAAFLAQLTWGRPVSSRTAQLDRDPLYTTAFRNLLQDSGVKLVRLPARSPNLKHGQVLTCGAHVFILGACQR